MLMQIVSLILGTLCDFLSFAFLARFAMQWARAPFANPIGRFVVAVTDWAVRPARRVVPGLFGLDLASFVLAWLVQSVYVSLVLGVTGLYGGATGSAMGIAALGALVETLRLGAQLAMVVVIVSAVLSWINPYSAVEPLFSQLSRPLLRPVQRFLPPIGGVDLSPLVVLVVLQVVLLVLGNARVSLMPFVGH